MRQVAGAEQVDAALHFGSATGEPACSSKPDGQYQCTIGVTSGTRMYLLVGPPGAQDGSVWWVAQYVPEESAGP